MAETKKIGPVEFEFRKMLAIEAFEAFEELRPGLAEAASHFQLQPETLKEMSDKGELPVGEIIKAIGALSSDTVRAARRRLFPHVFFSVPPQERMMLAGNEELAFEKLEAVHIYEVLGRAFFVNFSPSLGAIESLSSQGQVSGG